jgi:hypothetical protein
MENNTFRFRVNKSFRDTNTITIPELCHEQLENQGFGNVKRKDVNIICQEHDKTLNGYIYYYPKKPKHTDYYQIKMKKGDDNDYLEYLKEMKTFFVRLENTSRGVQVVYTEKVE